MLTRSNEGERQEEVGFLKYLSSRVSRPNPQTIEPPNAGRWDEKFLRLVPVLRSHEPRSALIAS